VNAMAADLYRILGVPRDASQEDIKRAYRKLARELHPDVNGDVDAEERFKQVTGAYEILSDPQKRRRYDAFGQTGGPADVPFTDIQDIFDLFFGGGGFGGIGTRGRRGSRRSPAQRGEDLSVAVPLTLVEAAFGTQRELEVDRLAVCDRCLGNGAEPGSAPIACRTCGGTGEVQQVRRSIFGTVMTASPCHVCRGTGQEILDPCTTCRGRGRVSVRGSVSVEIPAGVDDGIELRVSGSGNAGVAGGPSGDLFVSIAVERSPAFERRGSDLVSILRVPFTQAALGAELEVETIDGPERIKLEPGTEPGTVLRVRGKGVPNLQRRGRGDLYLTVQVDVPDELSKDERQLVERLAELRSEGSTKREPSRATLTRPDA